MGTGFILSMSFLAAVTLTMVISFQFQNDLLHLADPATQASLKSTQRILIGMYLIQAVLFVLGSVALVILVGHRKAGPYVALKRTFDAIQSGDTSRRLAFRSYDRLEDVSDSFNTMMDTLEPRLSDYGIQHREDV